MISNIILAFFLSEYRDSSFIERQKVTLMIWIYIILVPVSITYLAIHIYLHEMPQIILIDSTFAAFLLSGLILIKKGKFYFATIEGVIVVTLLAIWGIYSKRSVQIETGYNSFTVLLYGVMVFSALFNSLRVQIIVFITFLSLTSALYYYSTNLAAPGIRLYHLSNTLWIIFVMILVFTLLFRNKIFTDKALELAKHELDINTELTNSLEKKVLDRTEKLAQEREALGAKNRELEIIKNTLIMKNEELKNAKQCAENANEAKNRFLATLSHELRTPLNGIIGISELMLEMKPSAEDTHTLQMIKQSGQNLFFIIQDLLDYTAIENNQISIKNAFFNINDLMEQITLVIKDQIKNKNLSFIQKITPDNAVVYSDRTRISQIIMNLVSNSIKYTREGSIELSLIIGSSTLTIQVKDTGIGIEKDKIDTIFKVFTRVDNDYVKSQSGLGLGLSIVYQIITMMNGTIDVESSPSRGSLFTVKLPLEKPSEIEDKTKSAETGDYSIIQNKKILIVEDDVINLFYFTKILKKAGALVDGVINGQEALNQINSFKYDVILIDLNIPDFDGMQLARIIRNTDNPNRTVLISALSAHPFRDYINMCTEAGMNDFISKPIEMEQFLSSISALLKS